MSRSSSKLILLSASVATLLAASTCYSQNPVQADPPGTTAPSIIRVPPRELTQADRDKIKAATDAITQANMAITQADGSIKELSDAINVLKSLDDLFRNYNSQLAVGTIASSDAGDIQQIRNLTAALIAAKQDEIIKNEAMRTQRVMTVQTKSTAVTELLKPNQPLNKAFNALTKAKNELPDPTADDAPAEIKTASTNLETALTAVIAQQSKASGLIDSATAQTDSLNTAVMGFTTAQNVADIIKERAEKLKARISAVTQFAEAETEARLQQEFASALTPFNAVIPLWAELGKLTAAADTDAAKTSYAILDEPFTAAFKRLPRWLKTLRENSAVVTANVSVKREELVANPIQTQEAANRSLLEVGKLLTDSESINKAVAEVQKSVAIFDTKQILKTASEQVSVEARSFEQQTRSLQLVASRLKESLAGNIEEFIADQISLYYFTDIPRLMRVLNDTTQLQGGDAEAQTRAAAARSNLTRAEIDLTDAQTEVNNAQRRVQELQETLRQARTAADASGNLLTIVSRRLVTAQNRQNTVLTKQRTAQLDIDADPNSGTKQAALETAKKNKDNADIEVKKAEENRTDTQKDHDANTTHFEALKNEKNDLPGRLSAAKDKLEKTAAAVNALRRAAILSSQAEVEAFAAARDNTPFYVAEAQAASTDPAKRIRMYAFADSKTIFLRGKREDVDRVKEIIARFDQPVPQARLTLWSLQLNSDASREGTHKFNEALKIVEARLSERRAQIAASLSLLRDCINKQVKQAQIDSAKTVFSQFTTNEDYERRLNFYAADYQSLELRRLLRSASFDLPDPAATTTLGEALMVLSMAQSRYARNVIDDFEKELQSQKMFNTVLTQSRKLEIEKQTDKEDGFVRYPSPALQVWFASTRRALGVLDDGNLSPSSLRPASMEILRALKRVAQDRLAHQLTDSSKRLQTLYKDNQSLMTQLKISSNSEPLGAQGSGLRLEWDNIVNQIFYLFNSGLLDPETVRSYSGVFTSIEEIPAQVKVMESLAREVRFRFPAETSNARVAAADQMLKELVVAMEDDLDRYFIAPMLNELRGDLLRRRIGVGVLERKSVLASNRLIARVDPRASGQLAVGEEQNALQAVQQLTQIYFTAQTGGLLGALGGLNALPKETPPSLYGITTGSAFQVTPIIDPSGQALRFRFDYVSATQIREPDNSIDPSLPRIERHSVNTEIQLSNLELRNISQFDSNVRLGIPTRRTGGIPILKDIPGFNDIPLIGWFSKRSGRNALIQQSLIFAQTAIYPTISDITNLVIGDVHPEKKDRTLPYPRPPMSTNSSKK